MKNILVYYLIIFLFTACGSYNDANYQPSIVGDIEDNASWYSEFNSSGLLEMQVNIPVPNDFNCAPATNITAPSRACTLSDIDGDKSPYDTYEPQLHVDFSAADTSKSFLASMKQKGKSTRLAEQKSYRLKLDSKTKLYHKERKFQLDKHPFDNSRIRQIIFFQLFESIPNFTSLRTRFVHLQLQESNETNTTDLGLYTYNENYGKEFLINHGFNADDNLYKAQFFAFRMRKEFSLDIKGHALDEKTWEPYLEVERGKEQDKIVKMLEDLAQVTSQKEFDTFFRHYFNYENYITWIAINVIVGNHDTNSQNFFLLNPLKSEKFYFLPWDYDGADLDPKLSGKWEKGISNWWDVPLHKWFFRSKANREAIDAKIIEIYTNYINPKSVQNLVDRYKPIVEQFITKVPDSLSIKESNFVYDTAHLASWIDTNIQNYKESLCAPMPFWQVAKYNAQTHQLLLNWDEAEDLNGNRVVYEIKVANNYEFNTTIIDENISYGDVRDGTLYYTKDINLTSGTYYMRAIAYNENNRSCYQTGFDSIQPNEEIIPSVLQFEVQ